MPHPRWIFPTLMICFLSACGLGSHREETPIWDDVNLNAYNRTPEFDSLDFDSVSPSTDTTYWELRRAYPHQDGSVRFDVVAKAGEMCADASNKSNCETAFAATEATKSGFGRECYPQEMCYLFVASMYRGNIKVWDSLELFEAFLQPVNSEVEALLIARVHFYTWSAQRKDLGAIRELNDGYQLVLSQGQDCKMNRYLVHIHANGKLDQLRHNVAYKDEDVPCVMP